MKAYVYTVTKSFDHKRKESDQLEDSYRQAFVGDGNEIYDNPAPKMVKPDSDYIAWNSNLSHGAIDDDSLCKVYIDQSASAEDIEKALKMALKEFSRKTSIKGFFIKLTGLVFLIGLAQWYFHG